MKIAQDLLLYYFSMAAWRKIYLRWVSVIVKRMFCFRYIFFAVVCPEGLEKVTLSKDWNFEIDFNNTATPSFTSWHISKWPVYMPSSFIQNELKSTKVNRFTKCKCLVLLQLTHWETKWKNRSAKNFKMWIRHVSSHQISV